MITIPVTVRLLRAGAISPTAPARTASRRVALAAAVALGASGCSTWRFSAPPGSTTLEREPCSVPLSWDANAPIVEVFLGTKGPYRFLLDTGSEGSSISPACAREARVETWQNEGRVGYGGGSTTTVVEYTWIPEIRIGCVRFADVPVAIDDLSAFGIDGLLGFPLFADIVLTIDGPGSALRFSQEPLTSSSSAYQDLPLEPDAVSPVVRGLIGGQRALFKIDSGFDGTLYLPRSADQQFAIELASPSERSVRTIMGVSTVKVGTLRERVEIGDLTMEDVPVTLGWGSALLGGAFLARHVVSFDQRRRLWRSHAKR